MNRLDGKIALVTGGATGIGLASAKRFIDEGAFVYIFGRRQEALDAALAKLGPNARAVSGSVTEKDDLDRLFAVVRSEHGRLDILLANAGHSEMLPLREVTLAHYDAIFDINVKGTLLTVQGGLPLMGAGGSIILTGSAAGVKGVPAYSVYSATKAAIRSFARTWSQDLRGTGIRINVLSPGVVRTELAIDMMGDEALAAMAAPAPLERVAETSEIAAVAAFLASSDSSFMTGTDVAVDGGVAQI